MSESAGEVGGRSWERAGCRDHIFFLVLVHVLPKIHACIECVFFICAHSHVQLTSDLLLLLIMLWKNSHAGSLLDDVVQLIHRITGH